MIDADADAEALREAARAKAGFGPTPPSIDRLPPHSIEAEQGVIGCILLDPNECMDECITKLHRSTEAWYDLRHASIWRAMVRMYEAKEGIDIITLSQTLKDAKQLEEVGGMGYLAILPDTVPSAANLSYYLGILVEKMTLRKMMNVCTRIVSRIYDGEGEVQSFVDRAEREVMAVREVMSAEVQEPIKRVVDDVMTQIRKSVMTGEFVSGMSTGFPDVDEVIGGLQNGEMFVIGARPSVGKTSLAMNIVEFKALGEGMPVGVFSLEMTDQALVRRMIFSRARVNAKRIRGGEMTGEEQERLEQAQKEIREAPIFIEHSSDMDILDLRARARRMVKRFGIKLFVIDYLQLLTATGRKVETRQQEVSIISKGLKGLGTELNVPVIVLSQLTRDQEKGGKFRKPHLSDLRESGAIEQDADLVALLFKHKEQELEQGIVSEGLIIAKNRNGETDEVDLHFHKAYTFFICPPKITGDDLPLE